MIYVIESTWYNKESKEVIDLIKIGYTENFEKRKAMYKLHNPLYVILYTIDDCDEDYQNCIFSLNSGGVQLSTGKFLKPKNYSKDTITLKQFTDSISYLPINEVSNFPQATGCIKNRTYYNIGGAILSPGYNIGVGTINLRFSSTKVQIAWLYSVFNSDSGKFRLTETMDMDSRTTCGTTFYLYKLEDGYEYKIDVCSKEEISNNTTEMIDVMNSKPIFMKLNKIPYDLLGRRIEDLNYYSGFYIVDQEVYHKK